MADLDKLLRAELRARDADIPAVDLLARVHATARRRAVTRRAIAIGSAAVATVVAIVLAVGLPAAHRTLPARPPAELPSNPLVLGIRPGWLPPGWTVAGSVAELQMQEVDLAGHESGLAVQPHATIKAWYPGNAPIGIRAGDRIEVGGHPGFSEATVGDPRNGWEVAWQYAPGAWTSVTVAPGLTLDGPAAVPDLSGVRDLAVRLAAGLVLGVREPLRFPFALVAAPAGLRPTGAVSVSDPSTGPRYAGISFDGQPGAPEEPAVAVQLSRTPPAPTSSQQVGPDRRVNGHRARFFRPRPGARLLEVDDLDGWTASLQADPAHVRALGGEQGMLMLAARIQVLPGAAQDSSRWTDRPIR